MFEVFLDGTFGGCFSRLLELEDPVAGGAHDLHIALHQPGDGLGGPVSLGLGEQVVLGKVLRQDLRQGGLQIARLGGGNPIACASDGEHQGGAGQEGLRAGALPHLAGGP